jgi:hypothetical protein
MNLFRTNHRRFVVGQYNRSFYSVLRTLDVTVAPAPRDLTKLHWAGNLKKRHTDTLTFRLLTPEFVAETAHAIAAAFW